MSRTYKANDVRKICETKAQADFRSTKETNGWIRNRSGKKVARVTIPKGRDPLAVGTLGSIISQLKLNKEQFIRFIECSMSRDEYLNIIS